MEMVARGTAGCHRRTRRLGSAGGVARRGWKLRQGLPTGDFDWREVSLEFQAFDTENSMQFALLVGDVAEGLWIDDISVVRIDGPSQ